MIPKKGSKITFKENNKEKEYDILFTFETDEKNYIIYTDNTLDEDGFIKTYAGIYHEKNGKEVLFPVESDEEWELIETLLEKVENTKK